MKTAIIISLIIILAFLSALFHIAANDWRDKKDGIDNVLKNDELNDYKRKNK